MDRVSRPLIGLLVATVAFFALWIVALKPSSSSTSGSGGTSSSALQSAIASAHQAVTTSNNASARDGAPVTTTPATSTTPAATPAQTAAAKAIKLANAANHRAGVVSAALAAHKVLALLFYNPAATDDRAVKQELKSVSTRGKRVVKLAVPVNELARYAVVSNQVPVSFSPTLVLIDRSGSASTIAGFADRFEIAQRVADALATRP
jgi:hypothetical protein